MEDNSTVLIRANSTRYCSCCGYFNDYPLLVGKIYTAQITDNPHFRYLVGNHEFSDHCIREISALEFLALQA